VGPYTVTITHNIDIRARRHQSDEHPVSPTGKVAVGSEIKFYHRKRRNAIFQEIADTIGGNMVADV
jgi:hypothetical protein